MAKAQSFIGRNFFSFNGELINLHAFEGGMVSGEVIKDSPGPDLIIRKHLGAVTYEDFVFETGLSDKIIELIKKSWTGENLQLPCSFITADANFKVDYEDSIPDWLLTETIIPPCDAASKEPAFFRLRIKPALIRNQKGDGRLIRQQVGLRQKAMLKSNFKFELGSLPCSRIATIDSLSVKVNVSNELPGSNRVNMTANSIDFPNIFLTISAADLKPWLDWHKQFIIDGNNSQSDELSGRLVFLAPDLHDELLAIRLQGVGIFSLQRVMEAADRISRFRVGLYCERMELEN